VTPGRALRIAPLLLAAALALGCSSGGKPKPTPLQPVEAKISGRQVWQSRVDSPRFPLRIAVAAGAFHVAGGDGTVLALRVEDGQEQWRGNAGAPLSAGVGSDGRFASVVTRDNDVVLFERGEVRWRKRVPARVVTPPLVAGERVFVMSVDRVVHAFDALDGRRLWTLQRPGEALTLAQPGVLASFRNTLLVGQGPRLLGVDPLRGTVQWDVAMANPRGTNEVERLADLVGPIHRNGDRVCARSFQAAVGCADAARGVPLWTRPTGGIEAIGGDSDRIFGADGSGRVSAWRAGSGDVLWTSERLLHRDLSGAVGLGSSVVVGDFEGWVHFLSADGGEPQLRLPTDGSAVLGSPVLSGTTLLVATRNGGLFAFRPN
jgi:outer membrane protein assembly factor BamB